MNRKQMIEWLVDNDMDYLNTAGGMEWLRFHLVNGFEGYEMQHDSELEQEIRERNPDFFNEIDALDAASYT